MKHLLQIRATGANRYAGGSVNWLKIRKIIDVGHEYEFHVVIRGSDRNVGVPKEAVEAGDTPNLAFRINSYPSNVKEVVKRYFEA